MKNSGSNSIPGLSGARLRPPMRQLPAFLAFCRYCPHVLGHATSLAIISRMALPLGKGACIMLLALFLAQTHAPETARALSRSAPAAHEAAPQPANPPAQSDEQSGPSESAPRLSPVLPQDFMVAPAERELSANARETYAYLLFMQTIMDEDEAAMLDVAPLLAQGDVPPGIWLEGGVWLIGRKSPNAVVFLEQALKSNPEDLSLNLLYAEALGDHGMAARGIENMRQYLDRHPDSLDAKVEMAFLLIKDRQFEGAQKLLASISPRERNPMVDYCEAKALMGLNRPAEAIPFLRKAVKGLPEFPEAVAELAFAYEQVDNLREARATYERLKKLNYSPQEVALRLVNLSLRLKQPNQALQYIRQGPNTLAFRITAANMLIDARHYLQAEGILKQIVASDRAPVEVYLMLAELAFEHRRNLPAALAWLDKIPDMGSHGPKVELLRAQLMAEADKPAEALKTLAAAIAKYPDATDLYDLEIRLLAREKKLPEALAAAARASEKWPANTRLAFLQASILDESGDRENALRMMEKILEQEPDNYQALNYVGFTLAEQDRELERALALLQKANELAPDQGYIVDSLAWAHYKLGQNAEALRLIRRAVGLGERADAAIWDHYGDIALKEGKRDEARRAYRRALELKPDNAAAIRAKLSRI